MAGNSGQLDWVPHIYGMMRQTSSFLSMARNPGFETRGVMKGNTGFEYISFSADRQKNG